MDTKRYLDALEKIMEKRYPHEMYHIGGYQEDAVCIQSNSLGWIVYNAERGNHYEEIQCDTILKACLEFIRKMTHRIEDISSMENELLQYITEAA